MSTEQQELTEQVQYAAALSDVTLSEVTAGTAGFTSLGKCLQQARVQAGFGVQQIASEMHLDVRCIELIERDRFKELGPPVFVKGYLHRYARIVNVDETLLHGLYEALRDPPVAVDPVPVSMNSVPQQRKLLPNWTLWTAASLFAIISIGTVLNKLTANSDLQVSNKTTVTTVKSAVEPHLVSSERTDLQSGDVSVVQSQEIASQTVSKPAMVLASVAPMSTANAHESIEVAGSRRALAPGHVALTLKFNGDSWVEIYDANKRIVLFDMGHNSNVREVSGLAPLNVVFGSAPQIAMQINGREITLPAKRVTANVARFVVDTNGVIN